MAWGVGVGVGVAAAAAVVVAATPEGRNAVQDAWKTTSAGASAALQWARDLMGSFTRDVVNAAGQGSKAVVAGVRRGQGGAL